MSDSDSPGNTADPSEAPSQPTDSQSSEPWYVGISRYQWIVLAMGSLGWIFDAFEGQLFVACMKQAIPALVEGLSSSGDAKYYENLGLAAFLLGGAVGGFTFGYISDRIGRSSALMLTILTYSFFTGITYFVTDFWQMLVLRFLAALGTGGEWAVASAMVAEAFPASKRARASSIFHGSSVFGSMIAAAIGAFVVGNPDMGWRPAFVIGALPALVCVFIRLMMHNHPERASAEKAQLATAGDGRSPWRDRQVQKNVLVGVSMATVGLATFWGVHIHGREVYLESVRQAHIGEDVAGDAKINDEEANMRFKKSEMFGMWLATLGGGVGLFAFGPICDWIGRRRTFVMYHLAATAASVILFFGLSNSPPLVVAIWLPVFGFCTLGMHAGYAVYFPELFPTRIRGAAGGFCFNFARITAAPALFLSGWLQSDDVGYSFTNVSTGFSLLFLLGAVLILFGPETKGKELPD